MINSIKEKLKNDSDIVFLINIKKLKKKLILYLINTMEKHGFVCDVYHDHLKFINIGLICNNDTFRLLLMI